MEKFREIFKGQERAHGCYIKGDINEKGKQTGESRIVRLHPQPDSLWTCLLYTSPSPRDVEESRMPSSA